MVCQPVGDGRFSVKVDYLVDLEVAEKGMEPVVAPKASRTERGVEPEEQEQVAGPNVLVSQVARSGVGLS
jgi:hypothetical protein